VTKPLPPVPITQPYDNAPGVMPTKSVQHGVRPAPLSHAERRCNEIWLRVEGTRIEKVNFIQKELNSRYGVQWTPQQVMDCLFDKRASRMYRQALRAKGRALALKSLQKEVPKVVEDYKWARETARAEGDYRVTHDQAVDHLDRLGVTLKREQAPVQLQAIILRGKNFDAATLDVPTPAIEAAEIIPEEDAPA